jgi:hypothetical protein
MTVQELINLLQLVDNKNAKIDFIGNNTDSRDHQLDIAYSTAEVWRDGENTITLFIYTK